MFTLSPRIPQRTVGVNQSVPANLMIVALHTSSLLRSKSLSSSIPRYENVRNVRFFLRSAATWGSVTEESAYKHAKCPHRQHSTLYPPPLTQCTGSTHHLAVVVGGLAVGSEVAIIPALLWCGDRKRE